MLQPLEIPQTDPFGALEVCETVADIFNGAWIERLWMAQEMIFNPQTSMLLGKELVDFDVILSMPAVMVLVRSKMKGTSCTKPNRISRRSRAVVIRIWLGNGSTTT
jgi:hypothetical protein